MKDKDKKVALLSLYLEIKPLLCLCGWQPLGILIEKLCENLSAPHGIEVEGLTLVEIKRLRRWAKNARNVPKKTFEFVRAVYTRQDVLNGNKHRISALNYLMWGILADKKIPEWTNQYFDEMWFEVYGYECSFSI